ncbi:MAG: hypothetical protein HY532_00550 [Chloroflexi bacterium]|nr:hypothetical protein [Chloroflexota bacterium]
MPKPATYTFRDLKAPEKEAQVVKAPSLWESPSFLERLLGAIEQTNLTIRYAISARSGHAAPPANSSPSPQSHNTRQEVPMPTPSASPEEAIYQGLLEALDSLKAVGGDMPLSRARDLLEGNKALVQANLKKYLPPALPEAVAPPPAPPALSPEPRRQRAKTPKATRAISHH